MPTLSPSRHVRLVNWLPILVALVGAVLLVWRWAEGRPLWLDEEMVALNLRGRTLSQLAGPLWLNQSPPLGWLWLERLAVVAFGTGERAMRLLPLLCGLGTLACAVWVGLRWLGAASAALLAFLCAFGPWLAYHALELKPYSSDALWGLLLPALAAWALDARTPGGAERLVRRATIWWGAAALGVWFANGALLVAPACAVVLVGVSWHRGGWRPASMLVLGGLVWLVSFGLHYEAATRHLVVNQPLQRFWDFAMAPAGVGVAGALEWAVMRLRPLALKPGGTTHPLLFWIAILAGIVAAVRARVAGGLLIALVPLSALAWGALRLVPLFERLALWVVPALYVGVAVGAEGGVWVVRRVRPRAPAVALAIAAIVLAAAATLAADLARNSRGILLVRRADDAHGLDDRAGVRSLMKQWQPGDVVLTTRLAVPAVWWYGGASWTPEEGLRTPRGERVPVFQARLVPARPGCAATLVEQLGRPSRVLLYLGFRHDDWPQAREDALLARLAELGALTGFRPFAETGGAMVFDLRQPPGPGPNLPPRPWVDAGTKTTRVTDCVAVAPADLR